MDTISSLPALIAHPPYCHCTPVPVGMHLSQSPPGMAGSMQHGPHSVGRSSWMPPHGSNPTRPPPASLTDSVWVCPCRHARSDSSLRIFSLGCSFQRSPYRLLFIDVSPGAPSPRSCSVLFAGLSSLITPQAPHHPGPLLADLSSRALVYKALLADPLPRIPSADSSGWAPPGRSSPRIPWRIFSSDRKS